MINCRQFQRRMTVRQKICLGLAALTILLAAVGLWAHHSPSALFDMSKRVAMGGTLTKIDWINPHIVVYIDGKAEDGKTAGWGFCKNTPPWVRGGWGGRGAVLQTKIGQTVKVEGVAAKDGSPYGYLQKITFADGSSMELANATDESR